MNLRGKYHPLSELNEENTIEIDLNAALGNKANNAKAGCDG